MYIRRILHLYLIIHTGEWGHKKKRLSKNGATDELNSNVLKFWYRTWNGTLCTIIWGVVWLHTRMKDGSLPSTLSAPPNGAMLHTVVCVFVFVTCSRRYATVKSNLVDASLLPRTRRKP